MTEEPSHSELPPSSADKWFHCHAWRRLNAGIEDIPSEAAAEGTRAHEWLAGHLANQLDLKNCGEFQMYDHLMMCIEWVDKQEARQVFVEQKVDYGEPFGYVGLTGTADIIIDHSMHLTVADLKYGRGLVEVTDNLQLMIYLVGAVHKYGPRMGYRLVILQPRASHDNGPIRETWITPEQLDQFSERLEDAIYAQYNPRSHPIAGDHCRKFCKALGRCPAAKAHSLSLFAGEPE